jgi:hypothetical protein
MFMRGSFLKTEGCCQLSCLDVQHRINRTTIFIAESAPPVPAGEATAAMIECGAEGLSNQTMLQTIPGTDNGMDDDRLATADLEQG